MPVSSGVTYPITHGVYDDVPLHRILRRLLPPLLLLLLLLLLFLFLFFFFVLATVITVMRTVYLRRGCMH